MYRLFDIRLPNSKLGPCSSSLEHARREVEWLRLSGVVGHVCIEEIERDAGWGSPFRRAVRWCSAKNGEFRELYAAKETLRVLSFHFDTSEVVVCRKAREFGFGRRIDDPTNFEAHQGRWTEREDRLINLLYDDGMNFNEIPEHIKRTESAVFARLGETATIYSSRSQFGKFIVKGKPGRPRTRPV